MIELTPAVAVFAALAPLLIGGPLAVWAGARAERRKRALEQQLRLLGDAHGQSVSLGTPWALDGVELCVDLHEARKSQTTHTRSLRIRATHARLPPALRITPASALPEVGMVIGEGGVPTGDFRLDAVATLSGEPEHALLARMAPATRAAIAALVQEGAELEAGRWTLLLTDAAEPGRLQDVVRLVVGATHALIDSDPSPDGLRARTDDGNVRVRERALELALRLGPPDEWLARLATSEDPRRVLLASTARGEAGRERLWWLVDHASAPVDRQAAVALALLAPDARLPDLEAALARSLVQEPRVEVIQALGRIASVRAVAALRALEGPFGVGAVPTAARAAIREIQGRASGSAGQLALAEPRGGELAVADDPNRLGRMSEARLPERS